MARRLIAATVQPRFSGGAPFRSGVVLLNAARVKSVYADGLTDIIRYETNGVREYSAVPTDGISMTADLSPWGGVTGVAAWDWEDRFKALVFPIETFVYARPAYVARLKGTGLEGIYTDFYLDEGDRYKEYFTPMSLSELQIMGDTDTERTAADLDLSALYLNYDECTVEEEDDDDADAVRTITVELDADTDLTQVIVDYEISGYPGCLAYLDDKGTDDDDDDDEYVVLKPGDTIDCTDVVTLGLFDITGEQQEEFELTVTTAS